MSEALLFPEVERIDENGCRLISSLSTQSSSGAREKNVRGIMWHIIPSTSIDVLGFEFDYIDGATGSDLSIQLYARKGNFENFVSNEGAWSKIAETIAVPSPEGLGAIIPAKEIRPIQAEEGEIYSFYLHMTSEPVLEVTSPSEDTQVGSVWYEDDQMEISVGIGLSSGPFPDGGDVMGPSQFRGRLHYSAVKSCNETLTATEVELEFAGVCVCVCVCVCVSYGSGSQYLQFEFLVEFHGLSLGTDFGFQKAHNALTLLSHRL